MSQAGAERPTCELSTWDLTLQENLPFLLLLLLLASTWTTRLVLGTPDSVGCSKHRILLTIHPKHKLETLPEAATECPLRTGL